MAGGPSLKMVFQPMQIKNVKFKNRIVKTPQDMNFADFEDGTITQNYIDFYGALARGGVGGIIVEQSIVDPEGYREGTIAVFDDKFLPGMTKLAEAVHRYDCPIILQINHLGPERVLPSERKAPGLRRPGPFGPRRRRDAKTLSGLPVEDQAPDRGRDKGHHRSVRRRG